MVIVRTSRSSALGVVPEGAPVRRPGWARARERGPFFHQKDREGLQKPALAAGNDCEEQLRSIVLRSHGSKDGKEIKSPPPPNKRAKVPTL
jgi:hypothetical protein